MGPEASSPLMMPRLESLLLSQPGMSSGVLTDNCDGIPFLDKLTSPLDLQSNYYLFHIKCTTIVDLWLLEIDDTSNVKQYLTIIFWRMGDEFLNKYAKRHTDSSA